MPSNVQTQLTLFCVALLIPGCGGKQPQERKLTTTESETRDQIYTLGGTVFDGYVPGSDQIQTTVRFGESDSNLTDDKLKNVDLNALPNLTSLTINAPHVSDHFLRQVSAIQSLESLIIEGTAITSAGLAECAKLPRLTFLNVSDTKVTDEGIEYLSRHPKLETILLNKTSITDASISYFKTMPNLKNLAVQETSLSGVRLGELTQLEALDCGFIEFSAEDLRGLNSLVNLKWLGLRKTGLDDSELTENLTGLPNLVHLTLANNPLGDAGLQAAADRWDLLELDLSDTSISPNSQSSLKQFINLQALTLSGTDIDDLSFLSALPNLSELDLSSTLVEDIDLKALSHLKYLETLDVSHTAVSNHGLWPLVELANFSKLDCIESQVTDEGELCLMEACAAYKLLNDTSRQSPAAH